MKKITYICIAITVFLSIGLGFFTEPIVANTKGETEKREVYLNIMTVTKPQALMIDKLAGGKHNIDYLVDGNVNEFVFNENIIKNVSNMDLFLYTGASYETWINDFVGKLEKSNLGIIDLSRGIRYKENNPYYFVGYDQYRICLYNAKCALQDRDPQNREFYESNYKTLVEELDKVIEDEKIKVTDELSAKECVFLTTSNNFDYFFDSLALQVENVTTEDYQKVIENYRKEEKSVIVFSTKDQIEEFDFYSEGIEPVYLNCNELNKAFEDIFMDNISMLLDKIINI